MRKTDKGKRSTHRPTDELLLARLLGVEPPLPASGDTMADERLLSQLLLTSDAPAVPHRRMLRLLLAVMAMLALFACLPLASAAESMLAIRNNVAAMRPGAVEGRTSKVEGQLVTVEEQASEAGSLSERRTKGAGGQVATSPAGAESVFRTSTGRGRAARGSAEPSALAPHTARATPVVPASSAAQAADAPEAAARPEPANVVDAAPAEQPIEVHEQPSTPKLRPSTSPPEAAMTVLLLGVDRRPGQTGPARADSVIVARIDPQAGRVALVSFPRDLQVEIPGVGWDRINAMTVYGEMYPELGGGLDLPRRTVQTLLGIPIDHVVSVDFGGFISAVDALGGITVDVEREVYDSFTENYFAAGPQHMDGRTALWYSRIRFLDSDFERMRRQQSVLLGLMSRIREQNMLQQLRSLAAVTGALRGYIQTDLPEQRMVRLAWGLRNFTPEAVEQYRLEVDQVDIFVNPADPYAQYIRPGAIESLVRKLLGE